jgi:type IV pilus assembly protein PilC
MKFTYQARTQTGEIKTGEIEAFSKEAAIEILQRSGLFPTRVEEVKKPFYKRGFLFIGKISDIDLATAFRGLAALLRSGVPILDALNSVAKETTNENLKDVLFAIASEVESGNTLSTAMSHYPQVFSKTYTSMVKTGEIAGELPQVIQRIAENIENTYQFTQRVKGAMIYPAMILVLALAVFFFMLFGLIPKVAQFAIGMEAPLPSIVVFLLEFKDFLSKWWLLLLIFFASILTVFFFYFKTSEGKETLDRFLIKLPLFGKLLKMMYLTRISQNLNVLLASGVPIAQALEITEEITGNSVYQSILALAKDAIRAGEPLSSFLKDYPEIFPPFFAQMVTIGEKTGTLNKSLLTISDFYMNEVERIIENITTFLTPILIIFAAAIVALLLLSVLTTIYQTITII